MVAVRRVIAVASAALVMVAAGLFVAEPAAACSCPTRHLQPELAKGNALAVVSADGPGPGILRVLRSAGGTLPATLDAGLLAGSSCQPWPDPGRVAALIVDRRPSWRVLACAEVPLGEAFAYLDGQPAAEAGGPPVAVAVGDFGGSRVVGIDGDGRAVAWDGRPGEGMLAAVCPGNRTLLALGVGRPSAGRSDLSVHDLATVRVRRIVALPAAAAWNVRALACSDADGDSGLALEDDGVGGGRVMVFAGDRVRRRAVPELADVAVGGGGLVGLTGGTSVQSLVMIGPEAGRGTRLPLPEGAEWTNLAVAPTDDLIAVQGDGRSPRQITPDGFAPEAPPSVVVAVIDLAQGKVVAQREIVGRTRGGMGWTRSGRLLLWSRPGFGPVLELDQALMEQARRPALAATSFAVVGDVAVGYGSTRLALAEGVAPVREVGPLRLGAARHLVAVPERSFTPSGASAVAAEESASRGIVRFAAVAAAVVLAGPLFVVFVRRRSRARRS